ncbi:diacylglycerol kinase family protein [Massilia sp.]|uniref:diacylglycerol/lipid kinase family protein n=1 Tax=Massilia sp. TaxID=1882437 RepID=UPI0028A85569|nr:diacylglycerol kinase family protein [Massilia sp.]
MPINEPDQNAAFYVVLNAGSGHAETELRCSTIRDVLAEAGRTCHLHVVDDAAELGDTARRLAEEARRNGGVLVAAGGDGTINTVAHQAVLQGCVFGVLPQGTFNYFGRTHGIPEDLAEAVRALVTSTVQPVQIGMVNDRIFLVNASVGLYPALLEAREHDKRQYGRSRVVAILSALKTALGRHRPLRIALETEGQVRKLRTATLFVGNNRLQMEQVGMEPLTTAVEDGELAAIAPRRVGKLGMLGLLLRGALGRLGEAPNVVAFSFKRLTVKHARLSPRRTVKVATDGEVTRMPMPLEFRVLEGRLALLKPLKPDSQSQRAAA